MEKKRTANFWHLKRTDSKQEDETEQTIRLNTTTKRVLEELKEMEKQGDEKLTTNTNAKKDDKNQARSVDSASFTATTFESWMTKDTDYTPKTTKNKGYVSLVTNKGSINLKLHCDLVPRTCENFLSLCEKGYYNGTKFHRLIKNFMVRATLHLRGGVTNAINRFKEETRLALVVVANQFGVRSSPTNSTRNWCTRAPVYSPWPMPARTRTARNCKSPFWTSGSRY